MRSMPRTHLYVIFQRTYASSSSIYAVVSLVYVGNQA